MFKRIGDGSRFDSVSVVEVTARQHPDGALNSMLVRLCYIEADTGITFGYVDLLQEPMRGMDVLGKDALEAWKKFCLEVEKQQAQILFGKAKQVEFDPDSEKKDEDEDEGIRVGLGGGR